MNVPFLLTGGGFKGFEHGQYRMASKEITTLANLWATMLQDAGVRIDRFAAANGNTKAIASKHYLQVTEDHFAKAAQNTVQQPAVLPRRGRAQPELASHKKIPVLQGFAARCEVVQTGNVLDVLNDLFIRREIPEYIRSDNGSEFSAAAVRKWIMSSQTILAHRPELDQVLAPGKR